MRCRPVLCTVCLPMKSITITMTNLSLPRCMECRRSIAMRKLSVCLSVCQTRALWQNGRKICSDFYTIRKIV